MSSCSEAESAVVFLAKAGSSPVRPNWATIPPSRSCETLWESDSSKLDARRQPGRTAVEPERRRVAWAAPEFLGGSSNVWWARPPVFPACQ